MPFLPPYFVAKDMKRVKYSQLMYLLSIVLREKISTSGIQEHENRLKNYNRFSKLNVIYEALTHLRGHRIRVKHTREVESETLGYVWDMSSGVSNYL